MPDFRGAICRRVAVLCAMAGLAAAAAGPAVAADISVNAAAGSEALVRYYVTWSDDCGQGYVPKGGLSSGPAHGKVAFKRGTFSIPKTATRGSVRDCSGRKVTGLGVYYTPERGYRGGDSFRMWIDNGAAATTRYSVAVTVK